MIEFKNVEIKYGDFVAIKDLNLEINKGEFFTLLGPSGCGKTTTLRTLVGFNNLSRGTISIADKEVTNLSTEKRGIGMVFQSYALFPTMNVYENIAFGLKLRKLPEDEVDKRVRDVAKKVQITPEKLMNNVAELSGGQQQRVAIARALVLEPNILCLDEPLSNLDAKLRNELRLELKRLQKELGITTIYVTHDQEEALTLSDRIAVFNHGVVEQVGTPLDIYNSSKTEFVCNFIGDINKLDVNTIEEINNKTEKKLDLKTGYIRIEKTSLVRRTIDEVELDAKVKDIEFNGLYIKYTYDIKGNLVKGIEKNGMLNMPSIEESVKVYFDPRDIMQFGDSNE